MSITILEPPAVRNRQLLLAMESVLRTDGDIRSHKPTEDIKSGIPEDNLSNWLRSVRDIGKGEYNVVPTTEAEEPEEDSESVFSSAQSPVDSQDLSTPGTTFSSIVSLEGQVPEKPSSTITRNPNFATPTLIQQGHPLHCQLAVPVKALNKETCQKPFIPETQSAPSQGSPETVEALEVEKRLSFMERIQLMTTASSLKLKADLRGPFTSDQRRKLKQLGLFVEENSPELFRGRRMPPLVFHLVMMRHDSDSLLPKPTEPDDVYICVKGLTSGDEITRFHLAVSQKSCRNYYAPLRLCYDRSLVSLASREYRISHRTDDNHSLGTTSGSLLCSGSGENAWVSTVGGLIEMDGNFFLLAGSNHKGPDEDTQSEAKPRSSDRGQSTNPASYSGLEFDDDVKPPILLAEKQGLLAPDSEDSPSSNDSILRYHQGSLFLSQTKDELSAGLSWRLIPVPEYSDFFLPNYLSVPPALEATASRAFGYVESYNTDIAESQVIINAGVSGVTSGHLFGNPSYFLSNGTLCEIWTVQLKPGTGKYTPSHPRIICRSHSNRLPDRFAERGLEIIGSQSYLLRGPRFRSRDIGRVCPHDLIRGSNQRNPKECETEGTHLDSTSF